MPYPVYYMLNELLKIAPRKISPIRSSNPDAIDGFMLNSNQLWLWNYTQNPIHFHFQQTMDFTEHQEFNFTIGMWANATKTNSLAPLSLKKISKP
ncbi:MAG: hypothetical protein HC896_18280 [Bacteroidales bacterium]|nr:hypothetical protein [Bacteroidales bacterium]